MKKVAKNTFLGEASDRQDGGLFTSKPLLIVLNEVDIKALSEFEETFKKSSTIELLNTSLQGKFYLLDEELSDIEKMFKDGKDVEEVLDASSEITNTEGLQYPSLDFLPQGDIYFSSSFKHVGGRCESDEPFSISDIFPDEMELKNTHRAAMTELLVLDDVNDIKRGIQGGSYDYLCSVLSGDGSVPYSQLSDEVLKKEFLERDFFSGTRIFNGDEEITDDIILKADALREGNDLPYKIDINALLKEESPSIPSMISNNPIEEESMGANLNQNKQ